MKRIDLHIHTLSTDWDEDFEFDYNQLEKHVTDWNLDAIAITNHNTFDLEQYLDITERLKGKCVVLPGVEASALDTHLLLICDPNAADQMPAMCDSLRGMLKGTSDSTTLSQLETAFPLLDEFIVIPHYEKEPAISNENIAMLSKRICACETSSLKKALRYAKLKPLSYPFVYFTDYRFGCESMQSERKAYRPGGVYIRTDSCSFSAIRRALCNGDVALSSDGSNALELYPGITSTEGVNLVLGKRSTGKTYTLERVRALCDEDDIYYIEQGDLVKESKEKEFYDDLDSKFSSASTRYYSPISDLASVMKNIGSDATRKGRIATYLRELKKHAETKSENDTFSTSRLFERVGLADINNDEDDNVIHAIITILEADSYADALDATVGRKHLIDFLKLVVDAARKHLIEKEAVKAANKATLAVQTKLNQSSVDPYPAPKLVTAFEDEAYAQAFVGLVNDCWKERIVANDNGIHFGKYSLVATRCKYKNANEVKKALGLPANVSLDGITRKGAQEYVNTILDLAGVTHLAEGLFDLQIDIKDGRGSNLSGGQRTECVFLGRLAEAAGKSVILIDEPESSFDNPFLDEHIANQIRRLGMEATVFVTTHNQVLGFGLKPNKVFVTSYDEGLGAYQLHSGDIDDEALCNGDDGSIPTIETIIGILEAGQDSYDERRAYYERGRHL